MSQFSLNKQERLLAKISYWGTSLLRLLPAELAHELVIYLLEHRLLDHFLAQGLSRPLPGLKIKVPGIGTLMHPVGLAAGFDKDARVTPQMARLGFSFIEIGTVTPLSQKGNPKPRLFRCVEQRALINRMGFNSHGAEVVAKRVAGYHWQHDRIPLGVNMGKNRFTDNRYAVEDYLRVYERFKDLGRFFVANVSSPNTPGLRTLASQEFLELLAERLQSERSRVWIKLDPDRKLAEFQKIIEAVLQCGFAGVILCNTHKVHFPYEGGLSGEPLNGRALWCLDRAREVLGSEMPIISVGGVMSGLDVFERLARGASCVEIYTALIYRGPWVVVELLIELLEEMNLHGVKTVDELVGIYYR